MHAYMFDNLPGDQRLPHDTGVEVPISSLSKLGILYFHYPDLSDVDRIARERNYKNRDEITVSPSSLGDSYDDKVKMFFAEHLHEDEEIRYVLSGGGYFDVRNEKDEWVRLRAEKYDLLVLPAGIYHRFTTDEKDHAEAMRLFQDEPKWKAINRGPESEGNQKRQEYLKTREELQRS